MNFFSPKCQNGQNKQTRKNLGHFVFLNFKSWREQNVLSFLFFGQYGKTFITRNIHPAAARPCVNFETFKKYISKEKMSRL